MREAYQQAQEQGAREIAVLTLSSAMSGTHQSAQTAAEDFPLPVQVYDSRSNSMGLGWQVLAAARTREAGGGTDAMLEAAAQARETMSYRITLDTLEYLHRGGRIGGASRFLGDLLNLKPQIKVNHRTGEVEAGRRSRTRKRALQDLYRDFFDDLEPGKPFRAAVLHNADRQAAEQLAERIHSDHQPEELLITIVSPILGVHTGPRAVALCGYTL
jgi:DegV family protein with EDD domain